jgi:hypothetical protein
MREKLVFMFEGQYWWCSTLTFSYMMDAKGASSKSKGHSSLSLLLFHLPSKKLWKISNRAHWEIANLPKKISLVARGGGRGTL